MGRWTRRAAGAGWGALLVMAAIGGAGAQTSPAPLPSATPTNSPTSAPTPAPLRIPGLDGFSLPSDRATPAAAPAPVPVPAASPRPAPRATAGPAPHAAPSPTARPEPVPRATPVPRPSSTPTPVPVASPSPIPTPIAPSPTPTSPPAVTPVPTPTTPAPSVPRPVPAAVAQDTGVSPWWWATVAVLAVAGYAWSRRRRPPAAPPPREHEAPPPAPASPVASRARLATELLPRRGGLTLISLVFEGELLVRNAGDAPAERVTLEATLIPARSDQDAELGALFARPVTRPATTPFTLAPGEERRVRLVAALPLGGIAPLVGGGRSMVVPVLAANVLYATGAPEGGEGQTAASWIVGVARPGSDKLAPFWLDAGGLTDALAVRPHALAVTR